MRKQGTARLEVEAGRAFSPGADEFVDVGLPFGPKPRLILVYLNAEALRTTIEESERVLADLGRVEMALAQMKAALW